MAVKLVFLGFYLTKIKVSKACFEYLMALPEVSFEGIFESLFIVKNYNISSHLSQFSKNLT